MSSLPGEIVQMLLAPAVQKKLLSKPKVPVQRFLGCYQQVFETGAVLGHAFRENFPWLIQFFSEPGKQDELAKAFNQVAVEHLAEVGNPTSFIQIAMEQEELRIRRFWEGAGQSEEQIEKLFQSWELDPEEAFRALNMALNIGVAYGGTFPALVEQLWQDAYETPPDAKKIELLRSAGLEVPPDKLEPLTLANHERNLLSGMRSFLAQHHPALIAEFEAQFA